MEFKFQTKFEFKTKKKKNKIEKEKKWEASQAASPYSASRPTQPNRARLFTQRARTQPTSRPSPRALLLSLAAAAHRIPPVSPPIQLPRAHAQPPAQPRTDSGGRSGLGGHARGMALFPLAPRSRNLMPPLDAMPAPLITPRSPSAIHRAPWPSSAIKAPAPVALELIPSPRHHLGGRPLCTRAKRAEGEVEEEGGVPKPCDVAGVAGAGDDATTLHCTALLLELHGRNPPLHHHPISHDTYGEPPGSPPARRRTSLLRPWRSTP